MNTAEGWSRKNKYNNLLTDSKLEPYWIQGLKTLLISLCKRERLDKGGNPTPPGFPFSRE
jgi:hypothetical protein